MFSTLKNIFPAYVSKHQEIMVIFIFRIAFFSLEQKKDCEKSMWKLRFFK